MRRDAEFVSTAYTTSAKFLQEDPNLIPLVEEQAILKWYKRCKDQGLEPTHPPYITWRIEVYGTAEPG